MRTIAPVYKMRYMMKERGILFRTDMVVAILREDDPKTHTRRVVKPQPPKGLSIACYTEDGTQKKEWILADKYGDGVDIYCPQCPYGQIGDRLWVRETWCPMEWGAEYKADIAPEINDIRIAAGIEWHSPRFMPRGASRIILEITDIRTEKLHEISREDIRAEGVGLPVSPRFTPIEGLSELHQEYKNLWDSINGKTYPWASNPWLWVIQFKKLSISGG